MQRRQFLFSAAAVTALGALSRLSADEGTQSAETLRELIRANDEQIPGLLARQEKRAGHPWIGGIPNEYGIHMVAGTNGFVLALACAACAPSSKYFRAVELVEPRRAAIRYMLKAQ